MPNGHDKNLSRLIMVCASFHRRFDDWPTYVRAEPVILWDVMHLLGQEQFVRLAQRLKFSSAKKHGLGVGSRHGFVDYEKMTISGDSAVAARWLNVQALDERDE